MVEAQGYAGVPLLSPNYNKGSRNMPGSVGRANTIEDHKRNFSNVRSSKKQPKTGILFDVESANNLTGPQAGAQKL